MQQLFIFFFLLVLVPVIGIIEASILLRDSKVSSLSSDDINIYWGFKPVEWSNWVDGWLQNILFLHPKLWLEETFEKTETYGKYTNIIVYL